MDRPPGLTRDPVAPDEAPGTPREAPGTPRGVAQASDGAAVTSDGTPQAQTPDGSSDPPPPTLLAQSIGGVRGAVDSALPIVVFIAVNTLAGLRTALWAALAAGGVVLVERLARGRSAQQAFGGLLGLLVAVIVAGRTGSASGFFLPGILMTAAYGVAALVSVLVRRPLVGVVLALLDRRWERWREDPPVFRACMLSTGLWAVVFAVRAGVQGVFYLAGEPGWLAAAKLTLGWPLTAAAAAATWTLVRRASARRTAVERSAS